MLFICTTRDREYVKRRPSFPDWQNLTSSLTNALGADFQYFLAEPVVDTAQGKTSWYTELPGDAVPIWEMADSEKRAAALHRFDEMRRRVLAYADTLQNPSLRQGGQPAKRADIQFAEELRKVVRVPDEKQHVWCIEGCPVLVAWGLMFYGKDEDYGRLVSIELEREVVKDVPRVSGERVDTQPIVDPPTILKKRRRFPWDIPLWVLFACLVLGSYYLLLENCAFAFFPKESFWTRWLPNSCGQQAMLSVPMMDEIHRRDVLKAEIRKAELALARQKGQCAPPVKPSRSKS